MTGKTRRRLRYASNAREGDDTLGKQITITRVSRARTVTQDTRDRDRERERGREKENEEEEASGNANDRKRRDAEFANAIGDKKRISLARCEFQAIGVFFDAMNYLLV